MVIQPRLLVVYLVVFLIFNPDYISAKLVSGKAPKLGFLKSWQPGKETLKMEQKGTALLQFDEQVIDQVDEPYYAQQLELLVKFLGKKYTGVVLRVTQPKIEIFKKTLTTEFLKAVSTENGKRRDQNFKLIEVYLQTSVKFFLDRESLEAIQFLVFGLYNSITEQNNINGLIFEASLIQNPIQRDINYGQTINDVVYNAVKKFSTFMKTFKSTHGYSLKLGLAVSSLEECKSSMNEILADTMSLFEMAVYKNSDTEDYQQKYSSTSASNYFRMDFQALNSIKYRTSLGLKGCE